MYHTILDSLRESYNRTAQERDHDNVQPWKVEERQHFLALLQEENKRHLLEIGAGPGRDSKFFQENGLNVVCTDLSPEMVERCRAKGLTAYTMDFLNLRFPANSFDAVYALNCLLHVPKNDLRQVMEAIQSLLKPDGVFYLGVYGGDDFEGEWLQDTYLPKRFFSFYTDEQLKQVISEFFAIDYFKVIPLEGDNALHFQSVILRRN